MDERLEKRLQDIQNRIGWRERELKERLAEFSKTVARSAAMAEDPLQMRVAAAAVTLDRSYTDRIREIEWELDKLYEEKYMLEWIKGGQ